MKLIRSVTAYYPQFNLGCQPQVVQCELCQKIEALASEHEWTHDGWYRSHYTFSRYLTLKRTCASCLVEADDCCDCETLKIRVSDHSSFRHRHDVSIVVDSPRGNQRTLEALTHILPRRKESPSC